MDGPGTQLVKKTVRGFVGYCSCIWRTWEDEDRDFVVLCLEQHVRAGHKNGSI